MAYKKVLSQLFDVRPLNASGDLDFERIKKIRHILDLAKKNKVFLKPEKDYESKRTVNLKKKIEKKVTVANPYIFAQKSGQIFSDEQILKSLLDFGSCVELGKTDQENYKISQPSREEILAILDEVEKIDKYLKGLGPDQKEIIGRPNKPAVILAADQIREAQLCEPDEVFDLEQFLGATKDDIVLAETAKNRAIASELNIEEDFLTIALKEKAALEDEIIFNQDLADDKTIFVPAQKYQSGIYFGQIEGRFGNLISKIFHNDATKSLLLRGAGFVSAGFLIWLVIFGMSLAGRGLSAKDNIMSSGLEAYEAMLAGKESAARLDFSAAQVNFFGAYQNFVAADEELNKMGGVLISVLEKLPGGSSIASGDALIEAGKNLAQVGESFSRIGNLVMLEKLGQYFSGNGESLTQKFVQVQKDLQLAEIALSSANDNLGKVSTADLPPDLSPSINSLKEKLPIVASAVAEINSWSNVFLEIFGQQRAKKYLLIFQNNAEARPTGGFIGTYGILDLDEGRIKNLFIDGIFNLDGQLGEKVVPPRPIQKISTAWSTHDANWWPDFPTSAKKIMGFYEAAGGGSTVDGIISLTPIVVEKLLTLTGPIDMPEFNVTLDQNNFAELMQYKVESDYDKELNQPKKILADFAPKFLDRLWQIWPQKYNEIIEVMNDGLAEKQILFYFSDSAIQKTFSEQGWTGEVLPTDKDYLSVVNTNINGFKTDKVIEQKIYHESQVQSDSSIIDTVKIVRTHTGGHSQYDWYNKVNADYMRVYVPLGSKLLSANGQTLETYSAPADYQKLNFKIDPDVAAEEQRMTIDQNSGTQIFSESGKTVFGNWVYVSPGETVEVIYKYILPFKLNLGADNFSYSLLAQKQAGSLGSGFESILSLAQEFKVSWQYPENLQILGNKIKFTGDLKTDKFYGMVFGQ